MVNKDFKNSYRRSYQRFKVDGGANVLVDGVLDKPLIIRDLSSRGIGVMTDISFPLNKAIKVSIIVPFFSDRVTKNAKVVWCRKIDDEFYALGLDFGVNSILELS